MNKCIEDIYKLNHDIDIEKERGCGESGIKIITTETGPGPFSDKIVQKYKSL